MNSTGVRIGALEAKVLRPGRGFRFRWKQEQNPLISNWLGKNGRFRYTLRHVPVASDRKLSNIYRRQGFWQGSEDYEYGPSIPPITSSNTQKSHPK